MEPDKKTNGALIGAIIIIVLLVLGGVYVWQSNMKDKNDAESEEVAPADEEELNQLEKDLEGTSTDIEANVIQSVE